MDVDVDGTSVRVYYIIVWLFLHQHPEIVLYPAPVWQSLQDPGCIDGTDTVVAKSCYTRANADHRGLYPFLGQSKGQRKKRKKAR